MQANNDVTTMYTKVALTSMIGLLALWPGKRRCQPHPEQEMTPCSFMLQIFSIWSRPVERIYAALQRQKAVSAHL